MSALKSFKASLQEIINQAIQDGVPKADIITALSKEQDTLVDTFTSIEEHREYLATLLASRGNTIVILDNDQKETEAMIAAAHRPQSKLQEKYNGTIPNPS